MTIEREAHISKRVQNMPYSAIRSLMPLAEKARAEGAHVYPLNIGQPDIKTPPEFFEAVRGFNEEVVPYIDAGGYAPLVEAMQNYYAARGTVFEKGQLWVTCGGSEALQFAMATVADAGGEILVPEPYYSNYEIAARFVETRLVPIPCDIKNGYALPPLEEIERLVTPRTRAILATNPNNPTGQILSHDEILRIAELALRNGLFVLVDEAYSDFCYDGTFESFLSVPEIASRVIVCDSLSKRFSFCGGRVGCIASRNTELMKQVRKLCEGRLCVAVLEQVGATAMYNVGMDFFDDVKREYRHRRDVLCDELSRIPEVRFHKPSGAFYLMVGLPVPSALDFSAWMLREFRQDGATILMAPGVGFYATPGKGENEVRLAYVTNAENLRAGMSILKAGLEAYPGKIS